MLYYIIGAVVFLIMVYLVSYWIKKAMIMKAVQLFDLSELGHKAISSQKIKKMGLDVRKVEKWYGNPTVKTLAFSLLDKTLKDILKIKNIFNWKKTFIYGNNFIYTKYKAILGTVEINRLQEKIYELEEKQNSIQINTVMQAYGIHDVKRNKVLAGIIKEEVEANVLVQEDDDDDDERFDLSSLHLLHKKEPIVKQEYQGYVPTYYNDVLGNDDNTNGEDEPISVLDLDEKVLHYLLGARDKEESKKALKKIYEKTQKLEEKALIEDSEEDEDVNEILEEKGIKVED